jgi:hypothetical protein
LPTVSGRLVNIGDASCVRTLVVLRDHLTKDGLKDRAGGDTVGRDGDA